MTPPVPETHTPPRQIRIGPEWEDLDRATKAMGTVRARVVKELIRWYLREPGAKLPKRPDREAWAGEETP